MTHVGEKLALGAARRLRLLPRFPDGRGSPVEAGGQLTNLPDGR